MGNKVLGGCLSGLVLAAALALTGPAGAAPAVEWPERLWNPKAADGDLVLPMPCGGGMAFRKVPTRLPDNWLADERVRLGSPDSTPGFSAYIQRDYIAGSLSDDEHPRTRHIWIGKYEVTRAQYDAAVGKPCETPGMGGRLPKAQVSWFEAVAFTRRYTEWLLANAADRLPHEADSPAFLRLPTETEWEFAARGGGAVTQDEFIRRVFPMDGPMGDYVWHQGTSSCQGDLQLVGMLKPNPLGLHDMLGNVAEIMLEPFRMVRVGRRHGQVGGLVTRGGSCLTDSGLISSAGRTESNFFNKRTKQAHRPAMTGFRVVLAAPVQVSHERIRTLTQDWQAVSDGDPARGPDDKGPAQWLEATAETTSDLEAERVMRAVAQDIRKNASERADVERRAVQASIQSGAVLIRQYRADLRDIDKVDVLIRIGQDSRSDDAKASLERLERARTAIQARTRITTAAYTTVLQQTASDYAKKTLLEEANVVEARLADAGAPSVARFAAAFADQVLRWKDAGGGDIDAYLAELGNL